MPTYSVKEENGRRRSFVELAVLARELGLERHELHRVEGLGAGERVEVSAGEVERTG